MRTHMHCIHAHGYDTVARFRASCLTRPGARRCRLAQVSPPRTRHTLSGSFDGGCGLSDDGLWGLGPCGVWRLWRSASGAGAPWGAPWGAPLSRQII